MKLTEIYIKCFGHFNDRRLPLAADRGLTLVYGPNEAGKTTLLHFLRGLLFGFEERTPYRFFSEQIEGAARGVLADGRTLDFRRRKGRKGTVSVQLDEQETDLDERGLNRLLGDANELLFKSVFAFGLPELIAGEESLKHDNLQAALFGSGLSGVADPERVIQQFTSQAESLFKPSGSQPPINRLLRQLTTLGKELRERSVSSTRFQECQKLRDEAAEAVRALQEEEGRLRLEHARADRYLQAWPLWRRRAPLQDAWAALTVPDGFPSDAWATFEALRARHQRARRERDDSRLERSSTEQSLDQIQVHEGLLARQADIEKAVELLGSVRQARLDLPLLRSQHDGNLRQVERRLSDLRPDWDLAQLSQFRSGAAARARLEQLVDEGRNRSARREVAHRLHQEQQAEYRERLAEWNALGEPADLASLIAILAEEPAYQEDERRRRTLAQDYKRCEEQLRQRAAALAPPVDLSALGRLPLPPAEDLAADRARLEELEQQRRRIAEALAADRDRLEREERDLARLCSNQELPTREELRALRLRRDADFNRLVQRQADAADAASSLPDSTGTDLADAFRDSLRAADRYADRLFELATAVTRREQIDSLRILVTDRCAREAALAAQAGELLASWRDRWTATGIEPGSPAAMEAWRSEVVALRALAQEREAIRAEGQLLRERSDAFLARLAAAVGEPGEPGTLLALAARRVQSAARQAESREALDRDLTRRRARLAATNADLEQIDAERAHWTGETHAALAALELPLEIPPEVASKLVTGLLDARKMLDDAQGLAGRIQDIEQHLRDFDHAVQRLAADLSPDLTSLAPEAAAAELHRRLKRARADQARQESLVQQRDTFRRHEARAERELAEIDAECERLIRLADPAGDEARFQAVAETARERARLAEEIRQLDAALLPLRAQEADEEFEAALAAADCDELQARSNELARRLAEADLARDQAVERRTLAQRELDALRESGDAAALRGEIASHRAELSAALDRYMPLVLAAHVLRQAIDRFARDNQPELTRHVSEIFCDMTGGRYTAVERPLTEGRQLLVRLRDGAERRPHELSAGTREQLYLAIRLAYVRQYCRDNEPLPIVMDDVLVNFDDERAAQTLRTLDAISREAQVLFFTCHEHLLELARQTLPGLVPISLSEHGLAPASR